MWLQKWVWQEVGVATYEMFGVPQRHFKLNCLEVLGMTRWSLFVAQVWSFKSLKKIQHKLRVGGWLFSAKFISCTNGPVKWMKNKAGMKTHKKSALPILRKCRGRKTGLLLTIYCRYNLYNEICVMQQM